MSKKQLPRKQPERFLEIHFRIFVMDFSFKRGAFRASYP
jgi:hypothetical protein